MRCFRTIIQLAKRLAAVVPLAIIGGSALLTSSQHDARAEEPLRLQAKLPKDQLIVGGKPGGVYYAAKALKQEYDKLVARTQALRADIANRKITSAEALANVRALQADLERVRQLIDASKTFAPFGTVETKTETIEFQLGPEQLLFLNDISKVRIVGWDEPHVKCVLEKTVIGDGKQSLDEHFAGIRLIHRHGLEQEIVGRSSAEVIKAKAEFLARPERKQLTPEQLKAQTPLIEKIFAYNGLFQLFQEKPIDCIELEGLTHQQGNRQVMFEVTTPDGDGMSGGVWQRHAALTIYAPKCQAVGVRGGSAGLEAEGLKVPLIVRGDGDRDYDAQSYVRNHEGPLTVENIQLQTIENVRGDVTVTVSTDLGNSGTEHTDGQETEYSEAPAMFNYSNIRGAFTALLLKVNLQLSKVEGRVDIHNQFGDTLFTAENPLASAAHRILSQSGTVTLQLGKDALQDAPLVVATECGSVRRMKGSVPLVSGNISASHGPTAIRRTYRGFATKTNAQPPFDRIGPFERLETIAAPEGQSTPGLDVLSRAGAVVVEAISK